MFNLKDYKPCNTTIKPEYLKLEHKNNFLLNNTKCIQTIGTLLQIDMITKPEIYKWKSILTWRKSNPVDK